MTRSVDFTIRETSDRMSHASVGILEDVEIELVNGDWRVSRNEGGYEYVATGDSQYRALLNWVGVRLGHEDTHVEIKRLQDEVNRLTLELDEAKRSREYWRSLATPEQREGTRE